MTKNKHAWSITDLKHVKTRGVSVMSTFSCGGGSSLGYKLAGCDVVAANDIDEDMAWHYKENLKPETYFLCPISDLIAMKMPSCLHGLDILDGSPPCSTFSMSGSREKAWGVKKHFREGQEEQVLSELFFDYLNLVGKMKPKVAIAENVRGVVVGRAKGYAKLIANRFIELGYRPQVFLVNAADCGVPQRRMRVFFCAVRDDVSNARLVLNPNHNWVSANDATSDIQMLNQSEIAETRFTSKTDLENWANTRPGEDYGGSIARRGGIRKLWNHKKLSGAKPAPTLAANWSAYKHWSEPRTLTLREWKRLGSFPDDYVCKSEKLGKYLIGMSVPPRMTEKIAMAVITQWLGK